MNVSAGVADLIDLFIETFPLQFPMMTNSGTCFHQTCMAIDCCAFFSARVQASPVRCHGDAQPVWECGQQRVRWTGGWSRSCAWGQLRQQLRRL